MRKLIREKLKHLKVNFKNANEYETGLSSETHFHLNYIDPDYDISTVESVDGLESVTLYLEKPSYYQTLERLENPDHVWAKGEIGSLRKHIGHCSTWSDAAKEHVQAIVSDGFDFKITKYQTEMGLDYLLKISLTSKGALRRSKTNFLGQYEVDILRDFKEFRFIGLEFSGYNNWSHNYNFRTPIYRVISKSGKYFDYIAAGGSWYQSGSAEVIGHGEVKNVRKIKK